MWCPYLHVILAYLRYIPSYDTGTHLMRNDLTTLAAGVNWVYLSVRLHSDMITACSQLGNFDGMAWKHFPHYYPFVRRIHWSPVASPDKEPASHAKLNIVSFVVQIFDMWMHPLLFYAPFKTLIISTDRTTPFACYATLKHSLTT